MDAVISRSSGDEERGSLYHGQSAVKKAKTYLIGGVGLANQLYNYIHVLIADLVHQEADVRVKALRNLESIVTGGTYREWDPQTETMPLLRNLLEWFNLPTPSAADQVLALSILTTLAQDDLLRKMLADLGAVEFMKHLEKDVSPAILPFITSLVYTLRGRVDDAVFDPPKSRHASCKEPDMWSLSKTKQVGRSRTVEVPLQNKDYSMVVDMESERERVKEMKYSLQGRGEFIGRAETTSPAPLGNNDGLSSPSHESLANQSVSSREGLGHSEGYFGKSPFKQIPRTDSLSDTCNPDASKSIMPCIALEEIDSKYLININVTLQHLDNPQMLLRAFKELREAIVFDFHSEAILQKFCVVENTFEVLSKVKDRNVEHVIFEFLLELVRQIKGSIKISTEPSFQVHPENQPPFQAKHVSVPANEVTSQPDFKDSYPVHLKPGASEDSEIVWRNHNVLSGNGTTNECGEQRVFTLSHSLHQFVLQLLHLLLNIHHRDSSLNILYEILPLLKPNEDKKLPDKVQVNFTQYFHVLCEVLQTLSGNSEDIQALCLEHTRKRNYDSRARHCLPLLSVLTFSAELLLLLQPAHVAGLMPSYLVKALATSAGDLVFAECTFGTHKHIIPYLRYLDPEFYKSYTWAEEASCALHMLRKRLAKSEEALLHSKRRTTSPDIDVESLLTCMIEAAPHNSYHNDKYLVRKQVRILSDVLTIELVNAWKQRSCCNSGLGVSDEKNASLLNASATLSILDKARILILLLFSSTSIFVRKCAYDSVLEISERDRWLASQYSSVVNKGEVMEREEFIVDNEIISVDESGCLLHWRGGYARPFCVFQRFILYSPSVLGEIITTGLHDGASCKQSAELLLHLVEDLSEVERSELIDVLPWIECGGSSSPTIQALVTQISENIVRAQLLLEAGPPLHSKSRTNVECVELCSILRSLFSSCSSERWRASSGLLKVINSWSTSKRYTARWLDKLKELELSGSRESQRLQTLVSEETSSPSKDPFQHCFTCQEGLISSTSTACNQQPRKKLHHKISPSGQKKVEDLLSIFKSRSVGEIIRKSAVEHLIWLIQDSSLCCLLESDEELFKALIFEITNSITKDEEPLAGDYVPAVVQSNFDDEEMDNYFPPHVSDLGTACLSFLTRLASASEFEGNCKLRDLLVSNSYEHLWSLLPMVYHPAESARKDLAFLLSYCLFSSDLLLTRLKRMGMIKDPLHPETCHKSTKRVPRIFVPAPFARAYCFPCQVVAVQIKPLIASASETPVDEGLVRRVIAQTDLLEGGPENLLLKLEKKVGSSGDSLTILELQALSCLSVLHSEISVKRVLKLLSDPHLSCGVEVQFFEELEAQCFRHPEAAKILAKESWVQSFQRFLARFPSTEEEFVPLLKVMNLVHIIVRSKSADTTGFIAVTEFFKQTLLPLLAKGPNVHHATVVGEGYPLVDLEVKILRLVVDTLLYTMEHTDQELFCQVAVRLAKGTSLLSVLLSKFVKSSNSPYICCVLAVRCFTLIAKGLASFVGDDVFRSVRSLDINSQKSKGSSHQEIMESKNGHVQLKRVNVQPGSEHLGSPKQLLGTTVDQDLVYIIVPLIKHMAHLHSHHHRSLRHKGLVREIVSCLWSVTSFVLPSLWQDIWSSTGITYWLARLLEDHEAILRGMAFGILALLATPATPRTRELLKRNWPELGDVAVKSVLNEQECFAVREQGLCFLISSTNWTSNERFSITMEENCPPASFKIIDGLGVNAALQRHEFWNRLPSLLLTRNGTPGFHRVLVELILKLATSDIEYIKMKIYEVPTFFRALVQNLEFGMAQPARSGGLQIGLFTSCKHSAYNFAIKSCLGETLLVLAQDDDPRLQALIQSDLTITKVFDALNYCFSEQNLSILIVQETAYVASNKVGTDEEMELYEGDDCFEKVVSIAHYERLEAIFQLSELLNLITGKLMTNAGPFPNEEINHIRVDDIRSLRSSVSECLELNTSKVRGVLSKEIWRNYLGLLASQSGVFWGITRLLRRLPILTDLQDSSLRVQRQGSVHLKTSALLRRCQLGLCSLVGTMLSEESQAKAVLENCALKPYEVEFRRDPYDYLAENLCDVLLRLLKDAHEQVHQPKVSQEGDFIMYLQSLLMSVGRALQNLISFSPKAKDLGSNLDLPTTLMRLAYEVYSFLDSCGLVPKRLDNPSTPTSRSASQYKSKQSNKVPRLVDHSDRAPPFKSSHSLHGCNTSGSPNQGKLNEHHRDLLLAELILNVRLLKNFIFRNEKGVEACIEEGVFEFIWTLWAFALCEEDLMHELLGLLSNLAAQSNRAKEIIASGTCQGKKGGTLMDHVTNMLYHLPLDQISYTTSIGLLQNLVMLAEPRAIFMRKQYISDCLQLFRGYVRSNDVMRQHLMLQLFINLSAFPNGQKMFLKGLPDGSMLDLVLDSVQQSQYIPTSSSALFLLRNLAFCGETRFFFLCNERTLHLLVQSLESSSLEARAYASSALWILTSSERRVSAALKKIGACQAILKAHEAAMHHLKIFERSSKQKDGSSHKAEAILKMGVLVRNIEQSLFAVNQLLGEPRDFDSTSGKTSKREFREVFILRDVVLEEDEIGVKGQVKSAA